MRMSKRNMNLEIVTSIPIIRKMVILKANVGTTLTYMEILLVGNSCLNNESRFVASRGVDYRFT